MQHPKSTPTGPEINPPRPSQQENVFSPLLANKADEARVFLEVLVAIGQIVNSLGDIGIKIAPFSQQLGQVDWKRVVERLDALPAKSKQAMKLASENGWFFGWEDSLETVLLLVAQLDVVASSDVDDIFIAHYQENFQNLADRLITLHPKRAAPIKAAVNAHMKLGSDGYVLAIPVFIAQADGLLTEITGVASAFLGSRKSKIRFELQASEKLRELLDSEPELRDLVQPLIDLHELEFMFNSLRRETTSSESGEVFTALNRHQVMHGESCDYGIEINSLKAFSFLVFVGLHLPSVLEESQRKTEFSSWTP